MLRTAVRSFFGLTMATASLVLVGCADLTGGGGPGRCGDPHWTPAPGDPPPSILRSQVSVPLVVLRLDQHGQVCNREAFAEIAKLLRDQPTDVYVICPGWSSGYASAVGWSRSFLTGMEKARVFAEPDPNQPRAYRPIYVCVTFPADVLVSAFPAPPVDGGRRLRRTDANTQAVADVLTADIEPERIERVRAALLERGHKARSKRLDELMAHAAILTPPELVDLADCLLPLYGPQEEPSVPGPRYAATSGTARVPRIAESPAAGLLEVDPSPLPPIDPKELLEDWKRAAREVSNYIEHAPERPGDDSSRARRKGLRVAELTRWAFRSADLHLMKDWAWQAGGVGFGELLDRLKRSPTTPAIHLIGHSLGCEAILAGLSRPNVPVKSPIPTKSDANRAGPAALLSTAPLAATEPATEPSAKSEPTTAPDTAPSPKTLPSTPADQTLADTVLLLQPVVSAWCFASAPTPGQDVAPALAAAATPGVYRPVVAERVRKTVLLTRSSSDWVVSYFAPRALKRPPIEGLAPADSWAGEGKGALILGAAGPLGVEVGPSITLIPVTGLQAPGRYPIDPLSKLVTIDASDILYSHGDINEPGFWWLLANQVEIAR